MGYNLKDIQQQYTIDIGKEPPFEVTSEMLEAGFKAYRSIWCAPGDSPELEEVFFRVYQAMTGERLLSQPSELSGDHSAV